MAVSSKQKKLATLGPYSVCNSLFVVFLSVLRSIKLNMVAAAESSCTHVNAALEEAKHKPGFLKPGLATGVVTVGHLPGNSAHILAERCSS